MNDSVTQSKPTPGPWEVRDDHPTRACLKITRAGSRLAADEVAVVYLTDPVATYEANAALIVRAVNNHAALVEALEECRNAAAACFRVIAANGLANQMEHELIAAGVKEGFGKRAGDVLKQAKGEA